MRVASLLPVSRTLCYACRCVWRSAFFALLVWAPSEVLAADSEGPAVTSEIVVVRHPKWNTTLGVRAPRLRWPLATPSSVTSPFGERVHPIEGVLRRHTGVDLSAAPAQPIQAAAAGRVVSAGWKGSHGYSVEVEHAGGLRTRYSHLSELLVELGANVEAGSLLGLAGDTGLATGVHLHFEVWRNGQAKNPLAWFRAKLSRARQYVTRPHAPVGRVSKGSS